MEHGKGVVECSIHDSYIQNWNKIILVEANEVVADYHNLGIYFRESDNKVVQLDFKIIGMDD